MTAFRGNGLGVQDQARRIRSGAPGDPCTSASLMAPCDRIVGMRSASLTLGGTTYTLRDAEEGDVAAVIGETVRCTPFIPPPDWWKRVRAACDRHVAEVRALIADAAGAA